MRIDLKDVLNKLLNRKAPDRLDHHHNYSAITEHEIQSEAEIAQQQRCENILNYWLDIELFDLPECPFKNGKDILSEEADSFEQKIKQDLSEKVGLDPKILNEDSRLTIMFQCHKAGYIVAATDRHPNVIVPRTYLVAHSFVPSWDAEQGVMKWKLSAEQKDLIINLSTIRTIYRKCPPSTAHNMSLSEWIASRVEDIENILTTTFTDVENKDLFSTEALQMAIKRVNRILAKKFWPEQAAQAFMLQHCQAIDAQYDDYIGSTDKPVITPNNELTFRWRYCYYPEGNESQQLGPFFVKDLENCIAKVTAHGIDALSVPLQKYLLGSEQQYFVPEAVNQGEFFVPLSNRISFGRWPSHPQYGLSLLQTVAVNIAKEIKQNPVVAVNGPPGTGKTTLLKDIIADRFVQRTKLLLEYSRDPAKDSSDRDWFNSHDLHQQIMDFSLLVASSNNKAVENISKELPAQSSIDSIFTNQFQHFSAVAKSGDWGIFCAVLGNASNRKEFKNTLKKLVNHLKYLDDIYKLNPLLKKLKAESDIEKRASILSKHIHLWKKTQSIHAMLDDFKQCSNFKKHHDFFQAFSQALYKVADNQLDIADFIEHWKTLSENDWQAAITAIEDVKKQWFGKKIYLTHHQNKLETAKTEFDALFKRLHSSVNAAEQFILNPENTRTWELDPELHLTDPQAYQVDLSRVDGSAVAKLKKERALQQRSPFSSMALNEVRSKLFAAALALNEAILESKAKAFEAYWDDLESLLDGTLESNEKIPHHQLLWSILFLFFPVVSTSLSSVENQFKLMQQAQGFGLAMLDEAGQAVNFHAVGLLQRCKQVIFVGDPIQLEPVVTIPYQIDKSIAEDYLPLSKQYAEKYWGDDYLVSNSSAQSLADQAGNYYALIGTRKVGIPLLVHRRCLEPMFSIANRIAYDNKMVSATSPNIVADLDFIASGWIHVEEQPAKLRGGGYANQAEADVALQLIQHLAEQQPAMLKGGVFIITPFTSMKKELVRAWNRIAKDECNHAWMMQAFGKAAANKKIADFCNDHIGTVHTFQGKEASTVIFCAAASEVRKKAGGIKWVNSKPNLLNVAVTRAKAHLFVLGNKNDWALGTLSSELQNGAMHYYESFEQLTQQQTIQYDRIEKQLLNLELAVPKATGFYFGG